MCTYFGFFGTFAVSYTHLDVYKRQMLDVARELKRRKARRVFCISTFGMFTNGLESFDKAYEEGLIYKVITTNCTYQRPDLFERPWYVSCDVAKYIACLLYTSRCV